MIEFKKNYVELSYLHPMQAQVQLDGNIIFT